MATTGHQLRMERVDAGVTIAAVAREMHLSRQALWVLERTAEVRADRAALYRAAVDAIKASGSMS